MIAKLRSLSFHHIAAFVAVRDAFDAQDGAAVARSGLGRAGSWLAPAARTIIRRSGTPQAASCEPTAFALRKLKRTLPCSVPVGSAWPSTDGLHHRAATSIPPTPLTTLPSRRRPRWNASISVALRSCGWPASAILLYDGMQWRRSTGAKCDVSGPRWLCLRDTVLHHGARQREGRAKRDEKKSARIFSVKRCGLRRRAFCERHQIVISRSFVMPNPNHSSFG